MASQNAGKSGILTMRSRNMEATQTIDEKLDFDKVWAAIQAANEQLRA
jgi:hypothetical protein